MQVVSARSSLATLSLAPDTEVAASALSPLPGAVLSLKSEELRLRMGSSKVPKTQFPTHYEHEWDQKLGRGDYGVTYPATMGLVEKLPVAIKLFCAESGLERRERAEEADREVRRFVALGPHPNIVKLLDVGLFCPSRPSNPDMGLVFERYDIDLRESLNQTVCTVFAMRHIMRSLLGALEHMHSNGIVHTDLKPRNILLRGAGDFKERFRQQFGRAASAARSFRDDPSSINWIPGSFEVAAKTPLYLKGRFNNT